MDMFANFCGSQRCSSMNSNSAPSECRGRFGCCPRTAAPRLTCEKHMLQISCTAGKT